MGAIFDNLSLAGVALMVCNWRWDYWGARYRRCVPGTLEQFAAAAMRRRYRWPGFLFWPVVLPSWLHEAVAKFAGGSHWAWFWVLVSVLGTFSLVIDYRRLRRELEEDEDDWLNRGKRKLKRLARRAARSLQALVPAPSPA